MDLPVSHYLKIYRLRQRMAQSGVTKPSAEGRALIDRLVARLADLEPSLLCHLKEETDSKAGRRITFVVEGQELARLQIDSDES